MAAPTISLIAGAQSKSSGTSIAVSASATFALGDYIVVALAMDPAAGSVAASLTSIFTAAVASWTFDASLDNRNGSGTSGVRTVIGYGKVTTAGTITQVTITHPSVAARAAMVMKLSGADGTTPVNCAGTGTANGGATDPTITPGATGGDVAGLTVTGAEGMLFTSYGFSPSFSQGGANWTSGGQLNPSPAAVTSGGGAASNIGIAGRWDTKTALTSTAITVTNGGSASLTQANVSVVFQAPLGPVVASLVYSDRRVRLNPNLRR